jgi:hypothetical protein
MVQPQPQRRDGHATRVGDRVDPGPGLVDPDRRHLGDPIAEGARDQQQVDVEEEVTRGHQRHGALHDLTAQHLGAALGVEHVQPEQPAREGREPRARDAAGHGPADRQHGRGVAARGDGDIHVAGDLGQAQELLRGGRAVGVDEADQVARAAPEGLHQDPSLAELGELDQPHPRVGLGVGADDRGRGIAAAVERHEEGHRGVGAAGAVGRQRRADAALLVVGRDHDVERHVTLRRAERRTDGPTGPARADCHGLCGRLVICPSASVSSVIATWMRVSVGSAAGLFA